MRNIKKKIIGFVAAILAVTLILTGCIIPKDKVLASIGDYTEIGYYSHGGFQDYADYAKYRVENPNFGENPYLKQITTASRGNLIEYINDFELLMETISADDELKSNYDFDRSVISDDDFLYIYDKYYDNNDLYAEKFLYYNVYFLDYETNTLYYFHNNI